MRVMLTGAMGIVGRECIRDLLRAGHSVRAFDLGNPRNRRVLKKIESGLSRAERTRLELSWGNLTVIAAVGEACVGVDAILHLGAIIPPQADRIPLEAYYVNVEATRLLIETLQRVNPQAKLVFTSSISIYGDRRLDPLIKIADGLSPNDHDWYGQQKVMAEGLVRQSGLDWCILRLSYVVSPDKLQMDPLMFAMPLDTSIEICHARDVAVALRHAAEALVQGNLIGQTYLVAGGEACRTSYREYLGTMFQLFGLGHTWRLPEGYWGTDPFHCGFMETNQSQADLRFQSVSLVDYYAEVAAISRSRRFWLSLARPLAWRWLAGLKPKQQLKLQANYFARLRQVMDQARLRPGFAR